MLEVASLYFQLPALLERVDFLSVASNDLLQFLFASDRGNPQVSERYDTLSPALLHLLRDVVRMCDDADISLSLCGEMAGQPLEAMALIGIGFRHLSMNAHAVGGIRLMAHSRDIGAFGDSLATVIDGVDHSLRSKLSAFARDRGIAI